MIPIHRVHYRFCPRRLPFEEVFSDRDRGIGFDETVAIIVSNELVGNGERGIGRWGRCCGWSCMPASVCNIAEHSGVFVTSFVKLDLKWNWIARLKILMAMNIDPVKSDI